MVRIIPVIDLKGGKVVHAVGGQRATYEPIKSQLTASAEPLAVAQALRERFKLTELYVADLDAIGGAPPALALYGELREQQWSLWVDAGVRDLKSARPLATAGVEKVVIGQETVLGPTALKMICQTLGAGRIAFSLDLKDGRPLGDWSAWGRKDAYFIASRAIALGVEHLIVLDLARVGGGGGAGAATEELCQRLAQRHPGLDLVAGGGVRDMADVRRLLAIGIKGVLAATALHSGKIRPEEMAQ